MKRVKPAIEEFGNEVTIVTENGKELKFGKVKWQKADKVNRDPYRKLGKKE